MKHRQFKTDFWRDSYISKLTHIEKNLFIYLFTNDKVNMCGIYELPDRFILTETNTTQEELDSIKKKFAGGFKYFFYKDWIYIANYGEHNRFSTAAPVIEAFEKEFTSIPKDILKYFFRCSPYKLPIQSTDKVMVMVKGYGLYVKYPRPYPMEEKKILRTEDLHKEDIDPEDLPL